MAYNTIMAKLAYKHVKEYTATAVAITPGMLVELTSSGTVQAHSTSGGNACRRFAIEDDLQGKDTTDNYAVSTLIQTVVAAPGDEIIGLCANGEDISVGEFVASNGDGYLKAYAIASGEPDYVEAIVGVALEAIDFSGSSGADPASAQFKVEIV